MKNLTYMLSIMLVAFSWLGFAPYPTKPVSILIEQKHYFIADGTSGIYTEEVKQVGGTAVPCTNSRNAPGWQAGEDYAMTCQRVQRNVPYYGMPGGHTVAFWNIGDSNHDTVAPYAVFNSYGACVFATKNLSPAPTCETLRS